MTSEVAEFPLPADVTDDERATAKREIGKYAEILGEVKRQQARRVMQLIHSQPDLPRGNPAFGVAGARYCLRGHDKWNARLRPFKGRGRNEEDPHNDLRQCLWCVREDARARRNKRW